jgi:hypothetical protein
MHVEGVGRKSNSRLRWIALVAAGGTLMIAACGSSGKSPATTGSRVYANTVAYADCMRSHGVENFPDASPGGGFDIPSTINTQAPAYVSAHQTCVKLQPGPIVPPTGSERQNLQLVASANCMRKHGVNVADPTFRGPYVTLDVPDKATLQSPAFKLAEKACGYPIPNH